MSLSGSTGFFGKIPASGDFVDRGMSPTLRMALDRWLTRNCAQLVREPTRWPSDGVRGLWAPLERTSFALLILASQDAANRKFPLVFCANAESADQATVDFWAEAVLAHLNFSMSANEIAAELQTLIPPAHSQKPITPPMFWANGTVGQIEDLMRASSA